MLTLLVLTVSFVKTQSYLLVPHPVSPLSITYPQFQQAVPLQFQQAVPLKFQQAVPLQFQHTRPVQYQQVTPLQLHYFPDLAQQLPVGVKSTLKKGLKFSATRNSSFVPSFEKPEPLIYGRKAARNLDLCYFLGRDIFESHVRCNPNWGNGTPEGVRQYINELTFETNQMLGEKNFQLSWKGPYERHDFNEDAPTNPSKDVFSVVNGNCDAVIFLVFNKFAEDCETQTTGHDFGGVSYGGMCDQDLGQGYTVVVDQGFLDDNWTGPQILAHHLLLMLTSDLEDQSKHCPSKKSLLHTQLYPGDQRIDGCVAKKLNRSNVSKRQCMLDK